jgi:homocysteine S-methyltransferase
MTGHHPWLPQLGRDTFTTDGGIETTLVHLEGIELPAFAAFVLLDDSGAGGASLRDYYRSYGQLSRCLSTGVVLDTPTWRANADWGATFGYDAAALQDVNRRAVALLADVRTAYRTTANPIVISGCVGPRSERYSSQPQMSVTEALAYHLPQVTALASAGADLVTATTITSATEAAGIALAARRVGCPVAVGFTVETDGRLPDGTSLAQAVTTVDALTAATPAYYLISCAHPSHFAALLTKDQPWTRRIRGIRANASAAGRVAHDELTRPDCGDPVELARSLVSVQHRMTHLSVLGGCCGTDERHIEQIALALRGE